MKIIVLALVLATICATGCSTLYEQNSPAVKFESDAQIQQFVRSSSFVLQGLTSTCHSLHLDHQTSEWERSTEARICNALPGPGHP
jgi:hypothetical protein